MPVHSDCHAFTPYFVGSFRSVRWQTDTLRLTSAQIPIDAAKDYANLLRVFVYSEQAFSNLCDDLRKLRLTMSDLLEDAIHITPHKCTEHDLRAKCASDAATLEHARALLAHVDSRLTDRVYRRKPEMVRPLR